MKQHEFDDLLPEEAENQDVVRQLEQVCQVKAEDAQAIDHLRERWLQLRSASRSSNLVGTSHAVEQDTQREERAMITHLPSRTRPWTRILNQVAAVFVVALLVGILAITFALIEADRSGRQQQPATGAAGQAYCTGHSGVVLTEGLRLAMLSGEVGWAVGDGQSPYSLVLHTSDGGRHWQNVTPPVKDVPYLYILNENTAWLAAMDSNPVWLYRTTDAGASWQRFSWPATSYGAGSITFIDPVHGWFVDAPIGGKTKSLWQSGDGGKTWQKVGPLNMPGLQSALQFCNLQTGWISSNGVLYVTHNGGLSWKQQPLPDVQPGIIEQLSFISDKTGYLLAGDNSSPRKWYIYITQDGGQTWVRSGVLPANTDERRLLDVNHISGDTINISTGNYIILLLTLKNGQWVETRLNQPPVKGGVVDFSFSSVQVGVALGAGANHSFNVYQTSNGGTTWQKVGSFL